MFIQQKRGHEPAANGHRNDVPEPELPVDLELDLEPETQAPDPDSDYGPEDGEDTDTDSEVAKRGLRPPSVPCPTVRLGTHSAATEAAATFHPASPSAADMVSRILYHRLPLNSDLM